MQSLKVFFKSVLWVEIAAILGLYIAGALLMWVDQGHRYCDTFFTYRIYNLDDLPAWFAATLMLMVINGFWVFRLANIEGVFHTPRGTGWGEWGASVPINPLRLFAINLVAIPATLIVFLFIRANSW